MRLKQRLSSTLLIVFTTFFFVNAYAAFNYGEALQKAIFFYDIQRLGKIVEATGDLSNRVYWRGDSFLQDYALPNSEGTLDLGGGFADAGDNIKFNFPMASSTTLLAWSIVEFRSAYTNSNQLTPLLANLRWATDYLLKCWDASHQRLYGQVSPDSVQSDHATFWMPYEVIDQASIDKNLPRYGFYIDANHPGTDLAGETVAALAASSMAFQPTDSTYASQLAAAAKAIYQALVDVPNKGKYSDNMGRMVNSSWQKADVTSFYNSWSGYSDEVSWAAAWMYRITQDSTYLTTAKQYIPLGNTAATLSWDDKSYGAYLLLAKFLPASDPVKASAMTSAQGWLNSWSQGINGHSFSTDGLAIAGALTPWGNARYAATTAFGALIYEIYFNDTKYHQFAKNQIDYLLGNNSKHFSYEAGFGTAFPKQPHHATAEGRWDGMNDVAYPGDNRHIDYGGLVGGPKDTNDSYQDNRSDYIGNEVALDYNAGFVGALAALYAQYGGTPLPSSQFPPTRALENPPKDEFFVNGAVQSSYIDSTHSSIQVSLLATNHSAWPARVTTNLKVKYFLNLADKPANGTVTIQPYNTDPRAVISGLKLYDSTHQIYTVEVWFKNIPIYPGGDDRMVSSKETQLQFQFSWPHDFTKDWSYQGLGSQGNHQESSNVPIYEVVNGVDQLLYGNEPSSPAQGNLTVTLNVPIECKSASDTLHIGQSDNPTFSLNTSPYVYPMAAGGPYTVSLESKAHPITVTGGTCSGTLNAAQVNVPGSLSASYIFTATPPVDKGTIQISESPQSDPKCNNSTDTLFLDTDQVGSTFTVSNGIAKLLPTGTHTVKLQSQTSIPAGFAIAGYCTSTLDHTSVDVTKGQTSLVTATYQFHDVPPSMSCGIVSSKVTAQSDWGPQYGLVNTFEIKVNLQGFPQSPNGQILIDSSFTMKNNFVQNFWGNFYIISSSYNQNVGNFKGEVWPQQLPFLLSGFIFNKTPMKIGDNPLQSMLINGVTCR